LPGVPAEMTAMLDEHVMPRLRSLAPAESVLRSLLIHTRGLGESSVAEMLGDLNDSTTPTVAYMLAGQEVRVRITAKATVAADAETMLDEMLLEVRRHLGDGCVTRSELLDPER